ncbi:hypothetical protein [Geoglobus acetivorans]|uniref:Putative serine/threonine protein kinase n=2 Tax=Geoglobus acetivorans TaxID=565033 RepID=A0A0A7GDU7_GEOAI|nr:putative serine/threonine protein kinase [Geoglobus acetivorans]
MRGRHSVVRVEGDRAIKQFFPAYRYNFWKEAGFLSLLQEFDFVPRLYSINPEKLEIEMEFIEGRPIKDVINELNSETIGRILDICRKLDVLGIQKEEMNHPDRHIIISDRIVFIDFERGVIKCRPSNLTQFAVYLNSRLRLMKNEELKKLLREYKKGFDDESYRELRTQILQYMK